MTSNPPLVSETTRFWTLRHTAEWEELVRTGRLSTSWERTLRYWGFQERNGTLYEEGYRDGEWKPWPQDLYPHVVGAYWWLTEHLVTLLGPAPDGDVPPIWGWYQRYDARNNKPDLRRMECGDAVRMEFEVPTRELFFLHSDFWEHVVNGSPLAKNGDHYEDLVRREKKMTGRYWTRTLEVIRDLSQPTWEEFLDHWDPRHGINRLEAIGFDDPEWIPTKLEDSSIQVVLWPSSVTLERLIHADFHRNRRGVAGSIVRRLIDSGRWDDIPGLEKRDQAA